MDQTLYRNFDLIVEQTEHGYRARIHDSPDGQSSWVPFVLPFSETELAAAKTWQLSQSRHLRAAEQPPVTLAPQDFGQRLFAAIFQQQILIGLNRSLARVEQAKEGLRLRLRL